MVKGWAANITPLYDRNIYKKYFEQLPDFRKEKAAAQAVEQKRIQSVAAWSLWTKIRETYGVWMRLYLTYPIPGILSCVPFVWKKSRQGSQL